MAERFFPNDIPDYIDEAAASSPAAELSSSCPLHTLLSLPYPAPADRFLRAALDLKQKVVHETWGKKQQHSAGDFTLYTGVLGTALLLFRAFLITGDRADLATCAEIVSACGAASAGEEFVTFICGRAGVCAIVTKFPE